MIDAAEEEKATKEAETVEAMKQIEKLIEDKLEAVTPAGIAPLVRVESATSIQAVVEKTDIVPVPVEEKKPRRKRAEATRKRHKAVHPRKRREKK